MRVTAVFWAYCGFRTIIISSGSRPSYSCFSTVLKIFNSPSISPSPQSSRGNTVHKVISYFFAFYQGGPTDVLHVSTVSWENSRIHQQSSLLSEGKQVIHQATQCQPVAKPSCSPTVHWAPEWLVPFTSWLPKGNASSSPPSQPLHHGCRYTSRNQASEKTEG